MVDSSDFARRVAAVVVQAVNQLRGIRDSLYLDTNAWSNLAKGTYPVEPVQQWAEANQIYIWLSRFQIAELSADTRLARPLAEIVRKLKPTLIDRGQNEFFGQKWYKVGIDLRMDLVLSTQGDFDEFVAQLTNGTLCQANQKIRFDAAIFEQSLQAALSTIPAQQTRAWRDLPSRLERYLNDRCSGQGQTLHPKGLTDPERYVGLKLAYGVLFFRYYLSGKKWSRSDYVDYLHCTDMAYARTVVTEANLCEAIRQVTTHLPRLGPEEVHPLSWLAAPR